MQRGKERCVRTRAHPPFSHPEFHGKHTTPRNLEDERGKGWERRAVSICFIPTKITGFTQYSLGKPYLGNSKHM